MVEPTLTLFSRGLLSKWGFNDGEAPDAWYDYCDACGIDYAQADAEFPLVELVRRYLLPALDQHVTVVEIETCHNPIRAETVNGVDVTDVWYGRAPEPTLTPEYVEIPMSQVARLAREVTTMSDPPKGQKVTRQPGRTPPNPPPPPPSPSKG